VMQDFRGPQKQHSHAVVETVKAPKSKKSDRASEEALKDSIEYAFVQADIEWAHLEDWNFNVLDLTDRQTQACCKCLFLYERGADTTGSHASLLSTYGNFIDQVAKGYGKKHDVPYHNWNHAVDVCWMLHRTMHICGAEHFLSQNERFALTVSAVCHDIGHPGVNNVFLVETAHELAIRYNDHSPLENMHAARMFEIAREEGMKVFSDFDEASAQEIRAVSIEAILLTDYTHHFTMCKQIQMIYETETELFGIVNEMSRSNQIKFPAKEAVDVFSSADVKKTLRSMFLHMCDVSNPAKPGKLCQTWAHMILEEFFVQGDSEKKLGLAVQPLNDRDKVNPAYSQVGFIEFFVAPFMIAIDKIMPPTEVIALQMFSNLDVWFNEWVRTMKPVPEENEQARVMERIAKLLRRHAGVEP